MEIIGIYLTIVCIKKFSIFVIFFHNEMNAMNIIAKYHTKEMKRANQKKNQLKSGENMFMCTCYTSQIQFFSIQCCRQSFLHIEFIEFSFTFQKVTTAQRHPLIFYIAYKIDFSITVYSNRMLNILPIYIHIHAGT